MKELTSTTTGESANNVDDIDNNVIAQSNSASYRLLTKTPGTLMNFTHFARVKSPRVAERNLSIEKSRMANIFTVIYLSLLTFAS